MIYALENVEALWPKLDRAYKFDAVQNRSVATDATDVEGSYEVNVVLNEADAKALAGAMRKEFNAQRKDDWKDWAPKSLDDVFKKMKPGITSPRSQRKRMAMLTLSPSNGCKTDLRHSLTFS